MLETLRRTIELIIANARSILEIEVGMLGDSLEFGCDRDRLWSIDVEDKELLQKTYESSIDENKLPAKQYPSLEGLKTILDQLALKDPKATAAKPQDFVDARFVEELDKSGYIDSLYGRKK